MANQSDIDALQQRIGELERQNVALQQQLVQAQKLGSVGALASSITHEFNNILTTIINYAKLGMRHKDADRRDKAFDKILSAGQRASKITTGMLSYARGSGNRREATDLVGLVESVLTLVEKDLQVHRIHLETQYVDHAVANINANQIQQVLLNLIVNGRQAMSAGGSLTIRVAANPQTQTAELSVRDTGGGIPADKLPKIFDPFFSTKSADENGQGGTGIGLSLCRDIIESHRGRIRVESLVGRGTTFTLKFPLVEVVSKTPVAGPRASKPRVHAAS